MSLENDPHAPAAGRELEPDPRNAAALDRRWRLWSAAGVAGVLVAGALLGFVVIPVVQGRGAGIDPFTAICRAIGILPGSPAARQPPPVASSVPVSVVAWDGRTLSAVQGASARPRSAGPRSPARSAPRATASTASLPTRSSRISRVSRPTPSTSSSTTTRPARA